MDTWLQGSCCPLAIACCRAIKGFAEHEEKEKVMQFLMGLNESYATVQGSIFTMSPLPDTRKVHALEKDRSTAAGKVKKTFSHCDKDYHTADRGYFLHGFSPGHKLYGKDVKPRGKRPNAYNSTTKENFDAQSFTNTTFTLEEYNQFKLCSNYPFNRLKDGFVAIGFVTGVAIAMEAQKKVEGYKDTVGVVVSLMDEFRKSGKFKGFPLLLVDENRTSIRADSYARKTGLKLSALAGYRFTRGRMEASLFYKTLLDAMEAGGTLDIY
ncbi:hypothetical protein EZV62_015883 [Acer yangbiense]|uniref:Uncharacterized protein n=1 Tax=Acer yangbiense TaxID=1000413 RepID=A0A5C7HMP3_9ROSI|nr:hypothetical protein EZV62_015883 [Acer yangbiense]